MLSLSEILTRAYVYTKNHKSLWFFGFFLTGWGVMNFVRRVNLNADHLDVYYRYILDYALNHPLQLTLSIVSLIVLIVLASLVGAIARSSIIHAADELEKEEPISLRSVLKQATKSVWRVFFAGLFTNAAIIFFFSWLALPLWMVFKNGFEFRGFVLIITALLIFIPIIIVLSLVNIFACCYIVIYKLKLRQAFASAFDLLAVFWQQVIALFVMLFVIYFFLFFLSATMVGFIGVLAYLPAILVKSLSLQWFAAIILALIIILSFALLLVNAILNVFTNFAWTIFFLDIVKAKYIKDAKPVGQHAGG
ncbi:MAG: hypothetical protein AAB351_02690 [Patescibacteria group bacterium]